MEIAERLDKQRTLLSWLEFQVKQTRKAIQDLERQEAEEKRRRDQARRETRWKIQPSRAEHGQPTLHRGHCGQYERGRGLLDKDEVIVFCQQFPQARLCDICKPWGSLGIDKPPARAGRPEGGGESDFP